MSATNPAENRAEGHTGSEAKAKHRDAINHPKSARDDLAGVIGYALVLAGYNLPDAPLEAAAQAVLEAQTASREGVNQVGAAEAEVGRYVYRRIEALMDAKPSSPEAVELGYLTAIAESVEEYGEEACADHALSSAPSPTGVEGLRTALEKIAAFSPLRPGGDRGSYQRGYDTGFNNAGLAAAGIAQAALSSPHAEEGAGGDDDTERCIACDRPFKDGDRYYHDVSGGDLHDDCCGPERESYVNADGEPLKDGEPIPEPLIWSSSPNPNGRGE